MDQGGTVALVENHQGLDLFVGQQSQDAAQEDHLQRTPRFLVPAFSLPPFP